MLSSFKPFGSNLASRSRLTLFFYSLGYSLSLFPKHTYLFAPLIEADLKQRGGDDRVRAQIQHVGREERVLEIAVHDAVEKGGALE